VTVPVVAGPAQVAGPVQVAEPALLAGPAQVVGPAAAATSEPPSSPAARRATPYAVAARKLLRDTLFGAARAELEHRAWSEVTMADVARTAGVSRQTLYKEFGSRDDFAQAFVLREAAGFIGAVEGALDAHVDDPRRALTAAFGLFLTAAGADPLIRAAIVGGGEMLPFVTTQGQTLVEGAAARLCTAIRARWPQAAEHDAALLAECLVRLAISYASLAIDPAGMTASSITELLGPFIDRALQPDVSPAAVPA
jgi:AcrR family transcriptional regulator